MDPSVAVADADADAAHTLTVPLTPLSLEFDAGNESSASMDEMLDFLAASRSPTSVAAAPSRDDPHAWRERRRMSERNSRARRKTNLDLMREQVKVLEFAAANVPYALAQEEEEEQIIPRRSVADELERKPENRPAGGESVTVTSQAMQSFLRTANVLAKQATQLRTENSELASMVKRHEGAVTALRKLTRGMALDEWAQHAERWHDITLDTFTDWSLEACWEVVHDSMKKISKFSLDNFETTGLSFLGWRDKRRLDTSTGTIHFSFRKLYKNTDAEYMAQTYWDMHLNSERYIDCMIAPQVKCFYKVIQHVSPDICIARCVEQYPGVPFKVHMLIMIFRVRTSTGFLQGIRSIPCPELQSATLDDDAYWTTNFHWTKHDIVARNDKGECVDVESSVNGSIASSKVDYANRWMGEAILTVVRAESKLRGHGFLCS